MNLNSYKQETLKIEWDFQPMLDLIKITSQFSSFLHSIRKISELFKLKLLKLSQTMADKRFVISDDEYE